ncbi:MAG: transcriptional regulator [Acidobacteriota bacterium]
MPLTRDFRETIKERLDRSSSFRHAILREALNSMLDGEVEVGKSMLRDYINGTIGFAHLAEITQRSPKSLMRMLSPTGNPQAKNLFEILCIIQKHEGVKLELRSTRVAA